MIIEGFLDITDEFNKCFFENLEDNPVFFFLNIPKNSEVWEHGQRWSNSDKEASFITSYDFKGF